MINRILFKLTGRLPCRLIPRVPGEPYLERYYVGQAFGVTFYLHRFVSDDSEPHVHNHPWGRGAAFVLCGGYVEEVAVDIAHGGCVTYLRRVDWFNRIDGNHFHRIVTADRGTWTLFAHGRRQVLPDGTPKGWGFMQGRTFTPYDTSPGHEWWHRAPRGADAGRVPL